MAENEIELEISAIKTLLEALAPLTQEVRKTVLDYVINRLKIPSPSVDLATGITQPAVGLSLAQNTQTVHLKDFTEQKKPA